MASPSEAEVQTQWRNAVDILKETRNFASISAENWVTLEDTFVQALESDFADSMLGNVSNARAFLNAIVANPSSILRDHLRSYARHIINSPEIDDEQKILDRLYQHFIDNTLRVTSRQFTFGTPTPDGGNVGNGTILRLTKDAENFDIENQHADNKKAVCIADQNSGADKHEEIFEFRGQSPGKDSLNLVGSGLTKNIVALSARNSLLLNPSFSSLAGTSSSPTNITNWTSSVTVNSTNYTFDETNYYRDFVGDTTPKALNIKVTANLSQKISLANTAIDPDVPLYLQLAYNRQVGSASGTLVVYMGSQSVSVAVSAQTGWQIVKVPVTLGTNNWYKNIAEQDLDIRIEWTRTGGELLVDDVILSPFTEFDGAWYVIVPSATSNTPFLRDDFFTWNDTESSPVASIQYWLWRAYNRYLPHTTGGGVTFVDP